MSRHKKKLFYAAYVLGLVTFFLFYLFPADAVKKYVMYRLSEVYPQCHIKVDRIAPVFPPGLKFQALELYHRNALLLDSEKISIFPDFFSMFNPVASFSFKGRAYAGTIKGRAQIAGKQPNGKVDVRVKLAGIRMNQVAAVRNLTGRSISGLLDGNIQYDFSPTGGRNLRAELILSEGNIELLKPVFNLNDVGFHKIEADVVLKNQQLQVKRCVLKGRRIDGSVSGLISFSNSGGQSVLNLSGTVSPHLTPAAKASGPLAADKNKSGQRGFPVKVRGTLAKPAVLLQ